MTEEELNAIEARANAATPGPWAAAEYHPKTMLLYPIGNPATQELLAYPIQGGENSQNNAAFIAHARRDVPALMAHIRELQQELAEAYAELNRYQAQAFRGVAYEPTEEVNVEIRRARDEKQHRIDLLHRAAATDGAHHKQWLVVEVLRLLGEDISAYEEGVKP